MLITCMIEPLERSQLSPCRCAAILAYVHPALGNRCSWSWQRGDGIISGEGAGCGVAHRTGVTLLETDPSSRQGVVVAWDPGADGLEPQQTRKNVPCPYTFTVNIIGGALHLHNILRSNDMMLGCPTDVAGFALLQRILAARLG